MDRERESVERLRRGDIGGLAALVETHQVRAVRTAYLIVRDRALAEDLVQSAFIRAYERIGQFDAERPFGPWFLRSVANDAIKAVQRGRRTLSLDSLEADGDAPTGAAFVDPTAGPAALLEHAEDADAVWSQLARLPAAQRAALVLRYLGGLTDTEIATEVGAPPATVRWRLHAGRRRLRAWIAARSD